MLIEYPPITDDFLKAISESYAYVMLHCPRQTVIDYRGLNQDGIELIQKQWKLEVGLDVENIRNFHQLYFAIVADPLGQQREVFLSKSWLPKILTPYKDRILCLLAHSQNTGCLL